MKILKIEGINLFGIDIKSNKTLKLNTNYKLNLTTSLPNHDIDIRIKIMIIGMSKKDDDGFRSYRVVYRKLKTSELDVLREITEYFDSKKKEIPMKIIAKIG